MDVAEPSMEATSSPQAAAHVSSACARQRRAGQLWPLGVSGQARHRSAEAAFLEELEMQVGLLREENAGLRDGRHHLDVGQVIERAREPSPQSVEGSNRPDELFELMTECLLMRDGLVEACREIDRAMQEMQHRLDALSSGTDPQRDSALDAQIIEGDPAESRSRNHRMTGSLEGQDDNHQAHIAAGS